jgi:hypothetical protein
MEEEEALPKSHRSRLHGPAFLNARWIVGVYE